MEKFLVLWLYELYDFMNFMTCALCARGCKSVASLLKREESKNILLEESAGKQNPSG